jgi:hypothetical protein
MVKNTSTPDVVDDEDNRYAGLLPILLLKTKR